MTATSRFLQLLVVAATVVIAPLIGAALAGDAVSTYLAVPPRPAHVEYPGFSWPAFAFYVAAIVAVLTPFLVRLTRGTAAPAPAAAAVFPVFGWVGVAILMLAWPLAWGALPVPEAVRAHSFAPVWLGYILIVQGMTFRRRGRCLLTVTPVRFLALFPASALFWWAFEYLNQFVGNWVYQGEARMDAIAYLLAATLPFSTVLPAVVSTRDLLATWPALHAPLDGRWRLPRLSATAAGALALTGAVALILLPVWPSMLFSALWLAPLALLTGVQHLAGDRNILSPLTEGRWSALWLAAMASLVCGLFWEFWNWGSLARWEYNVPYVQGFYLFEMPILGYAGYLPFGLMCVAAVRLLNGLDVVPFAGLGPRRR